MSRIRVWIVLHKKTAAIAALFLLSITLAFGVGYLLGAQVHQTPIIIEKHSP